MTGPTNSYSGYLSTCPSHRTADPFASCASREGWACCHRTFHHSCWSGGLDPSFLHQVDPLGLQALLPVCSVPLFSERASACRLRIDCFPRLHSLEGHRIRRELHLPGRHDSDSGKTVQCINSSSGSLSSSSASLQRSTGEPSSCPSDDPSPSSWECHCWKAPSKPLASGYWLRDFPGACWEESWAPTVAPLHLHPLSHIPVVPQSSKLTFLPYVCSWTLKETRSPDHI